MMHDGELFSKRHVPLNLNRNVCIRVAYLVIETRRCLIDRIVLLANNTNITLVAKYEAFYFN
jgi:hypothetical protein